MWILPRQLHTLASVLDTEALISDSNEQSQICAQSLLVRSKPLPARTWSAKWKRDSWTRRLSGRILKPSHGQSFVTAWTSSLAATPVNPSQQPESAKEQKTQDTSGLLFQPELLSCDRVPVSLKTSRDISRWGCPTLSKTWQEWVTERRGAYSARLKSAHRTNASGCSSWPTATARDWKGCGNAVERKDGKNRLDTLEAVILHGPPAPASSSTDGSRQGLRATPRSGKTTDENPETWAKRQAAGDVATMPLTAQVKQWHTPEAHERTHAPRKCGHGTVPLANQVEQWGTPTARDHKSGRGNNDREYKELTPMVERQQTGKLNPRWVETLMGLPVGWVMPSCKSPVTIAPTNCDYSATELSPQPPNAPSERSPQNSQEICEENYTAEHPDSVTATGKLLKHKGLQPESCQDFSLPKGLTTE
jgi:hypothetical protein